MAIPFTEEELMRLMDLLRPCEKCGPAKFKTVSKKDRKYACRKCGTVKVQ